MKKLSTLIVLLFLTTLCGTSYAQFVMDGDESDWAGQQVLTTALDNLQDYFPDEVGAVFSDRVDVKEVKAKIYGNAFYFFIRFWGGPVWPNNAYEEDNAEYGHITSSRGYYHLMLDLDNDVTTGWNNHWYETHYTPLGYYNSQGLENTDPIGAETYLELGVRTRWSAPHPDSGSARSLDYYAEDVHEIDYHAGTGNGYDIYGFTPGKYDTSSLYMWAGNAFEQEVGDDTLRKYWAGHAWGPDFLEYGVELTYMQEYWEAQGTPYFDAGDVIGLAAFIETPIDDWGVDVSPRGEITVPDIPVRPSSITFDGDESDWADKPVLATALDNLQDYFPDEVGAVFSDRVDVKEVKAFMNTAEDAFYFFIRFWGGPVWPNHAYEEDNAEYGHIVANRGYYHLMMDLDNDATTGWNNHWYETHYTPLGYYNSQGLENTDPIGAEQYLELGVRTGWSAPHPDMGKFRSLDYYAEDVHEIDYHAGTGNGYDMWGFNMSAADTNDLYSFDGMGYETETESDTVLHWAAHAWGDDFVEYGTSLGSFRKYWASQGQSYLNPGDVIGVAAFIETPIDDWGVDVSPRGEVAITTSVDNRRTEDLPQSFALENNYPNPFNPETTIKYAVPKTASVKVAVFNMLGQKVRTLVDSRVKAGHHTATWDGRDDGGNLVSSGLYFYALESGSTRLTKSMTLLK